MSAILDEAAVESLLNDLDGAATGAGCSELKASLRAHDAALRERVAALEGELKTMKSEMERQRCPRCELWRKPFESCIRDGKRPDLAAIVARYQATHGVET